MNETDLFLDENESILDKSFTSETQATEEEPVEDEDKRDFPEPKRRRERKLAEKLQAEREASIAMAARLEALTEASRSKEESDYLKTVERIWGTDTPENAMATDLLKNAIRAASEDAKRAALEEIRAEQREAQEAAKKAESDLDSMVEDIEDEFGVRLTKEQEKGFFRLMEKLSPKDREGNVIAYADPIAVYEEYQERVKRSKANPARDLAARSMTQSGQSSTVANTNAEEAWLKEQGII